MLHCDVYSDKKLYSNNKVGLFEWELLNGESINKARTAAVTMFVIGQAFYLLNCRSLIQSMFSLGLFSNPWLWPGELAMLLAQAAFIYLPIMNWLFHSAPIGTEKFITRRVLERQVKTTASRTVTWNSPSS
jgi:magnesium-transporting ATPase (P-type)